MIQAYLDGPLGYRLWAKKYDVFSDQEQHYQHRAWINSLKVKLSGLSPVNYRKQATQSRG